MNWMKKCGTKSFGTDSNQAAKDFQPAPIYHHQPLPAPKLQRPPAPTPEFHKCQGPDVAFPHPLSSHRRQWASPISRRHPTGPTLSSPGLSIGTEARSSRRRQIVQRTSTGRILRRRRRRRRRRGRAKGRPSLRHRPVPVDFRAIGGGPHSKFMRGDDQRWAIRIGRAHPGENSRFADGDCDSNPVG